MRDPAGGDEPLKAKARVIRIKPKMDLIILQVGEWMGLWPGEEVCIKRPSSALFG